MVKGNMWGKFTPLKTVLPMSFIFTVLQMSSPGKGKNPSRTTQVSTWPGYKYSQLYKGMTVKTVVARDKTVILGWGKTEG